jgi:hypothetical protein
MSKILYKQFGQLTMADYEVFSSIPAHPFWNKVDQLIDFSFADSLCASLYSSQGQRPYAPSLKLKVHLVQRYYGLSDRETEERIIGDLFIKRFLGIPVAHAGIDHSTIALDRYRLGGELFHACHHHILAQALEKKLWGDPFDRWIVDAFHVYANISIPDSYTLIRQGILRFVRHLKRKNPAIYEAVKQQFDLGSILKRPAPASTKPERLVAFSKIVASAYALLYAMEGSVLAPLFWSWNDTKEQLNSLEHQAILVRILLEHTRPADPTPEPPSSDSTDEQATEEAEPRNVSDEPVAYVVNPNPPSDCIVSAVEQDARVGYKSKQLKFIGHKVQVTQSARSGLILNAEPIAAGEHDSISLVSVQQDIVDHHQVRPKETVADAAYGFAKSRIEMMEKLDIPLIAPVQVTVNPTGLFERERFHYDPESNRMICPAGEKSYRVANIKKSEGKQYVFRKAICTECPLREKCTTSQQGRSVFLSDHQGIYDEAKRYNESEKGKEALKERVDIERTNNEMKTHHGLKKPRTRGRKALRVEVKLTSMVINLKVIVKKFGQKRASFFRQKRRQKNKALVCA